MSADSDRSFSNEPLFACFFATHVIENFVLKREQYVGNDLLMRRIVFGLSAREEEIVPARQQRGQIFLRLKAQPVKTSQLVEEIAPNDQNIFVWRTHRCAPRSKGISNAELGAEQIQTRIRIGLSAI